MSATLWRRSSASSPSSSGIFFTAWSQADSCYHAAHIALLSKALQHSLKVCLRIDDTGFLSVQVMMPVPESMPPHMHNGILEFKVSSIFTGKLTSDARTGGGRRRVELYLCELD